MTEEIASYSFLPWIRNGIANNIKTQDHDLNVVLRASVEITLDLKGEGIDGDKQDSVTKRIALYGPGDIIGIDSKAIIKTEPRNWITNFEPNYIPSIEFYDEDFPWRYTPAAPDNLGRLRPWIMLVVLTEEEFEDGKDITNKPLPYIEVNDAGDVLPPEGQLWAWAHAHVNEDIVKLADNVKSSDLNALLPRLGEAVNRNPDLAYSRIVCPRKLAANKAYHAFLVPVFETGRLAGLGLDIPTNCPATKSAWSANDAAKLFPYYHRWYFRTGTVGDFEYLVRMLEPKSVDSRVGRRDMDVQAPGAPVSGITDSRLGGILKLGGALQVPFASMTKEDKDVVLTYENWDRLHDLDSLSTVKKNELFEKDSVTKLPRTEPHPFQKQLASFINLADEYAYEEAAAANSNSRLDADDDPMIVPPLYGRWHAMIHRLLNNRDGSPIPNNDNWIHELNLDPRWRAATGFGTKVIQQKQEEYMDAAWGQVGDILEANRKIRQAQLAKEASKAVYNNHIKPLEEISLEKTLIFTAPLNKRILTEDTTIYHHIHTSRIPQAIVSAPMRRIVRPSGRVMRKLPFADRAQTDRLLEKINSEIVSPAPPKLTPESLPTLGELAKNLKRSIAPDIVTELISKYSWVQYWPFMLAVVLILALIAFLLKAPMWIVGLLIGGLLIGFRYLAKLAKGVKQAESVLEQNQNREDVSKYPLSPDFKIVSVGDAFVPSIGRLDSEEAVRFKNAVRDVHAFVQSSGKAGYLPTLKELDIQRMAGQMIKGLNPELTIPEMVLSYIQLPGSYFTLAGESIVEAMAYPQFDMPMYEPLLKISTELFLPNINFIAQNSISLLQTNQKFIESYMVGLNHEFARELLWREFPTDQRGSYFRQFWDVSSRYDPTIQDSEQRKEKLRDIPPLHRWPQASKLGDHDQREANGEKEEEAVLVIRGELLKKYPTAVIYAQRAQWQKKPDGTIDITKERLPAELTAQEQANPPHSKIKTPLYEAKADPDIYFIGFDLKIEEAIGGTGEHPGDDPGWFFVIKERPGEPRFGLDIGQSENNVWNDLTWEDVLPGGADGDFIKIDANTAEIQLTDPRGRTELAEKQEQYLEDRNIKWNKDSNADELAYILFQVPVMVAVHASELLPKKQ